MMHSIVQSIIIIEKYTKLYFKKQFKEYDLNAAEGLVLLMMLENKNEMSDDDYNEIHNEICGKTQEQMIDELHYDKGVMTRTMQTLESKGYVLRNCNPDDSRSYVFTLTEKAEEVKPILVDTMRKWNDFVLRDIGMQSIEAVTNTLSQISGNAVNFTECGKED